LKTVGGLTLVAKMSGKEKITLADEKGGVSNVAIANVFQSNGAIHVADTVLMPN